MTKDLKKLRLGGKKAKDSIKEIMQKRDQKEHGGDRDKGSN